MTPVFMTIALASVLAQSQQGGIDVHIPLCDGECQRVGIDFDDDVQYKVDEVHGELQYPARRPLTGSVDESIRAAAAIYGVSYARLSCLARLESTFNPNAVNGRYAGLFQFDEPTFRMTPYAQYGRFNAYASAMGAAYLISRGEGGRWPPLARC